MVAAGRHARDALVRSFFFQAEDGIRDFHVTGVQTCALPISAAAAANAPTVRCSSSWPSSTTASRYRYSPARNADRSEERRVGKEWRARWAADGEPAKSERAVMARRCGIARRAGGCGWGGGARPTRSASNGRGWPPRARRAGSLFFFSSRRRHTRFSRDWSSDVCSSDLSCCCSERSDSSLQQQLAKLYDCVSVSVQPCP